MILTVSISFLSGALCLGMCAYSFFMISSVGTLIATLIRDWVRSANEHKIDMGNCTWEMVQVCVF